MTAIDSGSPPAQDHATWEEIATLVDRTTTTEERRRLIEHLSSCEACYELFAETARTVHGEEDAGTKSAPARAEVPGAGEVRRGPWGRRLMWGGGLLAAASVALLILTPLGDRLRTPGEVLPVADLAAPLAGSPAAGEAIADRWQDRGWPTTLGGPVALHAEHQRAFRLGVRAFELEVALRAERRRLANDLTYRLQSLVEADELSGALAAYYAGAGGIREGLRDGRPTTELLDLAREADDLLGPDRRTGEPGFADPFWYSFGKWAAAGELAAETARDEYFSQPPYRRFLGTLREAPLPPEVEDETGTVLRELERGPQDRALLREAFRQLIAVAGGGQPTPDAPPPA